jgi:hypothetical protein
MLNILQGARQNAKVLHMIYLKFMCSSIYVRLYFWHVPNMYFNVGYATHIHTGAYSFKDTVLYLYMFCYAEKIRRLDINYMINTTKSFPATGLLTFTDLMCNHAITHTRVCAVREHELYVAHATCGDVQYVHSKF